MNRRQTEEHNIRTEWFPEHKARYERIQTMNGPPIERLTWAKPDTGIFLVNYLFTNGTLFVSGDVGEAVFCWARDVDTIWRIDGFSLEYFASKCRASEHGYPYVTWDRRTAEINAGHRVGQLKKEDVLLWKEYEGRKALWARSEWEYWVANYGAEVFGDPSDLSDIGDVMHFRCHGYWVGLKMAFEQLKEKRRCLL